MIKSIKIENIALIQEQFIEFGNGLNVLSGETGAGKSININALCFALGSRADKSLIRNGQDFAKVTLEFDVKISEKLASILKEMDVEQEDTLIIVRKMSVDGKNEIKVNGVPHTLAMLKRLTILLCDVYGQFEHANLLDEKRHLQVLDEFGGVEIFQLIERFNEKLSECREIKDQISALGGDESERAKKIDFLTFQINEIDSVAPQVGEDESLTAQKDIMANAEKLKEAYLLARQALDGDEYGARLAVSSARNKISSIVNIDPSMQEVVDRLYSLDAEIDDLSTTLGNKAEACDFDAEEFAKVDGRLDAIKMLKRKYGTTIDNVLKAKEDAEVELNNLIDAEQTIIKLNTELSGKMKELKSIGENLTIARTKFARALEMDILRELKELGMEKSQFVVDIKSTFDEQSLATNGLDKVTFMFSANAGEPVKELSKIISGGELSRFMLAFKSSLAKLNNIGTQVYDEIDAGISGHIGQTIAIKLNKIARGCQVITISHLPQIVAMADHLYKIEKFEKDGKTYTQLKLQNEQESLNEIARLSGGANIGSHAIEFAKEMKQWAMENKENGIHN